MIKKLLPSFSGFSRQQAGAVTVEMAILLPFFLLLVLGILDFGHAWFMKQAITNASREGARYGITYKTNSSGVRIPPNALTPTIQDKVNQYLSNLLPSDANPSVTCDGSGFSASNPSGQPINVRVSAIKNWWIIAGFLPGLGSSKTITVTTTMNCE